MTLITFKKRFLIEIFLLTCLLAPLQVNASDTASEWIEVYCKKPSEWPTAVQSPLVDHQEIGSINQLKSTLEAQKEETFTRKADLGKQLFFDPRLSESNQISCASCHDPQLGWADGRRMAFGHDRQQGTRNTMSLFNAAFTKRLFWDGRSPDLQHQALMPIQDPKEMHASLEEVLNELNQIEGYKQAFSKLYAPNETKYEITSAHVGDALASFEKTILSRPTRFDRFVEGDCDQLTSQEAHGMHLFRTKARCILCHQGPLFSDNRFHHTGLSYFGRKYEDLGQHEATGKKEDKGKFRTPGLRELKHTGPYMHNGLFPHLSGVLNMYNAGMTFRKKLKPGEPALSPLIQPLHLTQKELEALQAFLLALSSKSSRYVAPPELPK